MSHLVDFFVVVLQFLHSLTGNYGWAIVIFSLCIKLLLYYPTQKQYQSMKAMQLVQPEQKRLQERFKDDPERLQKETMELFKRHGVNPLGGCLPMLAQMPVLYGIYGAIRKIFSDPLAPTESFLWIGTPLSHQYSKYLAESFHQSDTLLVLLYGCSMWLSQKATTPPSTDPAQMQQQKMMTTFMPIVFTVMMWKYALPCALVLYWLMFNLFSVVQQMNMKSGGPPPPSPGVEVKGGPPSLGPPTSET